MSFLWYELPQSRRMQERNCGQLVTLQYSEYWVVPSRIGLYLCNMTVQGV